MKTFETLLKRVRADRTALVLIRANCRKAATAGRPGAAEKLKTVEAVIAAFNSVRRVER